MMNEDGRLGTQKPPWPVHMILALSIHPSILPFSDSGRWGTDNGPEGEKPSSFGEARGWPEGGQGARRETWRAVTEVTVGLSGGDPPGFCMGDGREAVAGDRKSPTEEEKAELSHRAVGVMAVAIILIH